MQSTIKEHEALVRQRILNAARLVFLESGYKKGTNRLISSRASANAAMISYYFETKEQLFEEVLRQETLPLFEIIIEMSKPKPDVSSLKDAVAQYIIDKEKAQQRAKLLRETLLDSDSPAHQFLMDKLIKYNALNFTLMVGRRSREGYWNRSESLTNTWLPIFSSIFFRMIMPDFIETDEVADQWVESSIRIISIYSR
jgi:AcrR family transcriptional regulator